MDKPIDSETQEWIDRQLSALQAAVECAPDIDRGLKRLQRLNAERRSQQRRSIWTATGLAIAAIVAASFPPTRVYAVRCIDACLTGGQFVVAQLRPNQKRLSVSHLERRQAPDFQLANADGKIIRLSSYRGQVVVLNFWATWCNPCRLEIPWFVDFQETYGAKGYTAIGVSLDEDGWTPVLPYIAKERINYPVVLGKNDVLQAYGGLESLPTTLIIDRRGRIAATHVGLVSRSAYERDIVTALKESY